MMQIIGFGHKSRVGKDTLGQFLFSAIKLKYPKIKVRKAGFADELKAICWRLYAWDGMQNKDYYERHPEARTQVLPTIGKTPVEIWIEVGNKLREVYEDTWLRQVISGHVNDVLIITDVRFPNEVEIIKQNGGWLYKVNRAGFEGISDSDRALDSYTDWTEVIENTGGIPQLHDEADRILAKLEQQWQNPQST